MNPRICAEMVQTNEGRTIQETEKQAHANGQ